MIVKAYLINAFSDELLDGLSAAVVILRGPGQEDSLRKLARSFKQPVTAFVMLRAEGCLLRCFSPAGEILESDLGALAAGHACYEAGVFPPGRPVVMMGRGGRKEVLQDREDRGLLGLTMPGRFEVLEPDFVRALEEALGLARGEGRGALLTGGNQAALCLKSQLALKKARPGKELASLLATSPRLTLSAALEVPGFYGYSIRVFGPGAEESEPDADLSCHGALAAYWAGALGRSRLDIRPRSFGSFKLIGRVAEGDQVSIFGRIQSVWRLDPLPGELTADLSDFSPNYGEGGQS